MSILWGLNFRTNYIKILLSKGLQKGADKEETMQNINNTQFFKVEKAPELAIGDVIKIVHQALVEKGYNPVNQIVGYIMSGDPTYITSHRSARSRIMKVERDEILEELMENYIETRLR